MFVDQFVGRLFGELSDCGRYRMCDAYETVSRSLDVFCENRNPALNEVYTRNFLHCYETHLIRCGCKRNTISFYMNRLRAIRREAVKAGLLEDDPGLFDDVFTGTDPTPKRALTAEEVAILYVADLSKTPHLQECRDLFILCLCLQGMAFCDLARLLKTDLVGNTITYRRSKTGGLVQVTVDKKTRKLLEKYMSASDESPYLLTLLTKQDEEGRKEYNTVLRRHNRRLKTLAERLGLPEDLSSYSARHTWATLAHLNGAKIAVISQAMGHKTEEITHVYLSGFPQDKLEEANRIVFKAFTRPIQEGRVQSVVVEPATRGGRNTAKKIR